jgi:HCOMODA/2-hydroxy-3-carboxy-muconic semialdehyde decarboxylase
MSEENVREDLIAAAHALATRSLVTAFGHVSAKLGKNRFVMTPPKPPGAIQGTDELIEVPLDTEEIPQDVPGEVWIHWSIYRRRPEVFSVCRAQPEFAGIAAIAGLPVLPIYGHAAFLGEKVPIYEDVVLIRSRELGEDLAATLGEAYSIIVRGTGAVTVGSNVGESTARMLVLENAARMNFYASLAGKPKLLSPEEYSDWSSKSSELLARLWEYLRS